MHYIVVDLEFNQAFSFPNEAGQTDPRCPSEVIQIGAVKLDEEFREIDRFSIYSKPQVYRRIHPFVSKITGISSITLRNAPAFPQAYNIFLKWIGAGQTTLCTWGNDDVKELYRNMMYYKVNHRQMTRKYINVQQIAGAQLNFSGCIGLKTAAEQYGLDCSAMFHDALNDARYTANIFRAADKSQMQVQTLNLTQLNQSTTARVAKINAKPLYAFAERRLNHKLTTKEMDLILAVYSAGREGRFDRKIGIGAAEETQEPDMLDLPKESDADIDNE